jgi:hypothetical protein
MTAKVPGIALMQNDFYYNEWNIYNISLKNDTYNHHKQMFQDNPMKRSIRLDKKEVQ